MVSDNFIRSLNVSVRDEMVWATASPPLVRAERTLCGLTSPLTGSFYTLCEHWGLLALGAPPWLFGASINSAQVTHGMVPICFV